MAINDIHIEVAPERVFAVLADWRAYDDWLAGSRCVRGVDPGFPAVGTGFHQQVGVGPLHLSDHAEVVEVDPPRHLALRARARPFGTATVALDLAPQDGGTRVTMREDPTGPLTAVVVNPLTRLLGRRRSVESLRRLKRLAESRPDLGRRFGSAVG